MAGQFLGYDFDNELFQTAWGKYPNLVTTALIKSGVVVSDPRLSTLSEFGNYTTVPFYKPLDGEPANYDGQTDIPVKETEGGSMGAVAFGRSQGWKERDFQPELYGNDPMGHIVSEVGNFWNEYKQERLIDVIDAALGVAKLADHTAEVESPADTKLLPALINTQLAKIFGTRKRFINFLFMDSITAAKLENLNLLNFKMGVNEYGLQEKTNIGSFLGYTVVADDTVMKDKEEGAIYALGRGAIITGNPKLNRPAELERAGRTNGGETTLLTRIRTIYHPNGYNFKVPKSGWTESPTNEQLKDSANYELVYPKETINIAKLTLKEATTP